jgi:hypothetical protein
MTFDPRYFPPDPWAVHETEFRQDLMEALERSLEQVRG